LVNLTDEKNWKIVSDYSSSVYSSDEGAEIVAGKPSMVTNFKLASVILKNQISKSRKNFI